ncbi:MAG: hypothetical protein WAN50_00200 [Minisyncoccia bacterium]
MNVAPLSPAQQQLVAEWQAADSAQKKWRETELALRSRVMREVYMMDKDTTAIDEWKGTHYAPLSQGYRLKTENKTDYNLKAGEELDAALDAIGDDVADLLVKWKPELSVSIYKQLPAEKQALLCASLTIKNASPSLEIVAPKVK